MFLLILGSQSLSTSKASTLDVEVPTPCHPSERRFKSWQPLNHMEAFHCYKTK